MHSFYGASDSRVRSFPVIHLYIQSLISPSLTRSHEHQASLWPSPLPWAEVTQVYQRGSAPDWPVREYRMEWKVRGLIMWERSLESRNLISECVWLCTNINKLLLLSLWHLSQAVVMTSQVSPQARQARHGHTLHFTALRSRARRGGDSVHGCCYRYGLEWTARSARQTFLRWSEGEIVLVNFTMDGQSDAEN